MANLEVQRNNLFAEWTRKPKNIKNIDQLLENLKLILSQISFQQSDLKPNSLIHCRDVLEIGAFFSIETQRIDSFERYLSQLKVYYFDYKDILPESTNKFQLLGLNLLRLLSQNRLAEFHTVSFILASSIIPSNTTTPLAPLTRCSSFITPGSRTVAPRRHTVKLFHQSPGPAGTVSDGGKLQQSIFGQKSGALQVLHVFHRCTIGYHPY